METVFDIMSFFTEDYNEVEIEFFKNTEHLYIKPITKIYLHKTKNEMYIIMDCHNMQICEIQDSVLSMEKEVISFVNFGNEIEKRDYIKYNINLLLLCKSENEESKIFEIEKSKQVCRKIVVNISDDKKVKKEDISILPFYFNEIQQVKNNEIISIEKNLEIEVETIADILSKVITKNDINKEFLYRWLDNEH